MLGEIFVDISAVFKRWRPSVGVLRLAFLCGMLGMGFGILRYWSKVWTWADSVFWPHAYYAELAKAPVLSPRRTRTERRADRRASITLAITSWVYRDVRHGRSAIDGRAMGSREAQAQK